MNTSFQFVSHSLLNQSKSKATHQFPKAKRFAITKAPPCSQSSYDLTKTMMTTHLALKSSSVIARDSRFKSSVTIAPPPNNYQHNSFSNLNEALRRGNSFSHAPKLVAKNKNQFPAPGAHDINNPEKTLSYTMRGKHNKPDNQSKLGPGQYQAESYQALNKPHQQSSKYRNPKSTMIGTASRFKPRAFETIGPGPTQHSRVMTEYNDVHSSTFGCLNKEPSYIKKNVVPGPGSYNKFSQFSERKGELQFSQYSQVLANKTFSYS